MGHPRIDDSLPQDVDKSFMPADVPGASQCRSYTTEPGYAGPCPPNEHSYEFTLYAVDTETLGLDAMTVEVDDVESAAKVHTLAEDTLGGTYGL